MYLKRPRTGMPLPLLMVASLLVQSCAASSACLGEAERARDIQRRIDSELPLRGSDPVVDYVRAFGWRLAEWAGVQDAAHWRFEVLRDRSVNAFSIGDGHIYVTEGAILAANTESELAGVIAHEMGHQLSGHFCAANRGSYGNRDGDSSGQLRQHGYGAGSPGLGTLRQGMDPLKERDADRVAVDLLIEAGFDPTVRSNVIRGVRSQNGGVGRNWTGQAQTPVSPSPDLRGQTAHGGNAGLKGAKEILRREL